MKRFLPQNFNDFLCLILIAIITAIWVIQGCNKLTLSPEVTGALIVTWSLLVQYYFRRAPKSPGDGG